MRANQRLRSWLARNAELRRVLPVLIRRDLKARYRTSALDVLWALITPLALLAVYGVVLTQSFDVGGGCAPYLSSAWTGLILWSVFATSVGAAASSIIGSSALVTRIKLPLEAVPLATVGVAMTDLAVGFVSLIGLVLFQGVPVSVMWLATPLAAAVVVVWSAVISTVAAMLAALSRDVLHAVSLALRVGFFATPVMYETSFLPESLGWTSSVNPLAAAIDGARASLLCGDLPNLELLGLHLALGLGLFLAATVVIARSEYRIVDAS